MESLSDEVWDVIIAGTGIPQSILALSLSRSGKKVLHIDRNPYYGGQDTALSLQDAEDWAQDVNKAPSTRFQHATISTPDAASDPAARQPLGPPRQYNLSLNPQILYAQSDALRALVSSRIHNQLEFLAVGTWWLLQHGTLRKIPSTREDVFNDESLTVKEKRALMKFLRSVLQEGDDAEPGPSDTFEAVLETTFNVPKPLHAPLLALALSPSPAPAIQFEDAVARIRRHMRSMGALGPGFTAVVAKYGGNSEISQVACRAEAVGGGLYLLGQHFVSLAEKPPSLGPEGGDGAPLLEARLADGTLLRSTFVATGPEEIPSLVTLPQGQHSGGVWRSINIVAHPLGTLFPKTSEHGPVPAAAIVLVEPASDVPKSPVYLQIHSEDAGECPRGQCIIYASLVADEDPSSKATLENSLTDFLDALGASGTMLWSLAYFTKGGATPPASTDPRLQTPLSHVLVFPWLPHDVAFSDDALTAVREAWHAILGGDAVDAEFLRFEEREMDPEE